MSNLNVNEIEANGTNSNVKVVSKSTDGSCKIKSGSNDATLQLNCSAQSHGVKLKAPADSAGQNYTIALPDNQIAASKFLKVKSVVGSGSTGVGQLEFSDAPTGVYPNLNASNITTGTLPVARIDGFTPSGGAALKLISTAEVSSTVGQVDFTGLDDNSIYLIQARETTFDITDMQLRIYFLDSTGNAYSNLNFAMQKGFSANSGDYATNTGYGFIRPASSNTRKYQFTAHLITSAGFSFMWTKGQNIDKSNYSQGNFADPYIMNMGFHSSVSAGARVHGIRFTGGTTRSFIPGTTIHLYKYLES